MRVLKIWCPASISHLLVSEGAAGSQINILNRIKKKKGSFTQHREVCISPILADKEELISELKSSGCLGASHRGAARAELPRRGTRACGIERASSTKLNNNSELNQLEEHI